jgi:drug/metabolite transporter (DMT)-like permease
LQIVALNWFIYRRRTRWLEGVSILISLFGISLILGTGNPMAVFAGDWVVGDFWILAAVLAWALYSIFLKWRPPALAPLAFLGFTLIVGASALLPLWLFELASGQVIQTTPNTLLTIAYVAIFPSVLAYLFWNLGVSAVGPNTAGHFAHLMPIFGSLMAVVFLGEIFAWYHAVGAGLVALAIGLTIWSRR